MSVADQIYITNYKHMLEHGFWVEEENLRWSDGEKVKILNDFGIVNRYNIQEEFPILTLKKTNLFMAINEILWIWQKKSNRIIDLGNHTWDQLANSEGSIGKAYGYQLRIKHKYSEGEFDQVDKLLYDLKNNPFSRRMYANMYNFADIYESQIYPCAYSLTLSITDGKVNAVLNQRSQEMLCSNNWNVCQYGILLMMFAYACGYEPGELLHVISSAIVYDRHLPILDKIITLQQYEAPNIMVQRGIGFYEYTKESFSVENYRYNEIDIKVEQPIRINP